MFVQQLKDGEKPATHFGQRACRSRQPRANLQVLFVQERGCSRTQWDGRRLGAEAGDGRARSCRPVEATVKGVHRPEDRGQPWKGFKQWPMCPKLHLTAMTVCCMSTGCSKLLLNDWLTR